MPGSRLSARPRCGRMLPSGVTIWWYGGSRSPTRTDSTFAAPYNKFLVLFSWFYVVFRAASSARIPYNPLSKTDNKVRSYRRPSTDHRSSTTDYRLYRLPTLPTTNLTDYQPYRLPTLPTTNLTDYQPYRLPTLPTTNLTDYQPYRLPTLPTTDPVPRARWRGGARPARRGGRVRPPVRRRR